MSSCPIKMATPMTTKLECNTMLVFVSFDCSFWDFMWTSEGSVKMYTIPQNAPTNLKEKLKELEARIVLFILTRTEQFLLDLLHPEDFGSYQNQCIKRINCVFYLQSGRYYCIFSFQWYAIDIMLLYTSLCSQSIVV